MNRLELIKEIHALTKNKEIQGSKKKNTYIKTQLIKKEFDDFGKSFFDEWNTPENRIDKEQWHQFVRFCIDFEEIKYMFSRITRLLRRYRSNTDEYFKAKFQKGISELPDRSSELEQLFKFSREYFEIYAKIMKRINFERTNVLSSGRVQSKINWNSTLIKSITDFPLSFETDEWKKKFDTPENVLLVWIALWLTHQIQQLIGSVFDEPLDFAELKSLKHISNSCQKIVKYFPFYEVVQVASENFDFNVKSKKIQTLELEVRKRLKEGMIENAAYKKLLIWFIKMKTFNFPDIKKKDKTANFLRDAVKNIDEMYEIWIFFELLHYFTKLADAKLELNSEHQSIQFTVQYQNVELFYEKPFLKDSEFAWAQKHVPDFTILSNQKVLGVLDAKNYKNPKETETPKNKILAYMTNLSTGFGGIIWPNNKSDEYIFPRSDRPDSTKYHNNLKLASYSLNPRALMENTNTVNVALCKIFSEIKNRLEPATKCPNCGKIAIGNEEMENLFGFRNIDVDIKSQSRCRECRSL